MPQRRTKNDTRPTTQQSQVFAPESGEDDIRRRAYEIYLSRNGAPGNDIEDWLRAEREVCQPR